jgi:hypothetical protein
MADGETLNYVDTANISESVEKIYAQVLDFVQFASRRESAAILAVSATPQVLETLRNRLHYRMHWCIKCRFPLKIGSSHVVSGARHALVIAQA